MGWVDSDYAADVDTRRSMTGFVLSMNNGPIAWRSKRQSCVTLSSAEAEFVAASICGTEIVYLRLLLRDLGLEQSGPTVLYEDNAACIKMSENPVNAERSRHIDTRDYWLREQVRWGHVKLLKCAGTQNVADALTKSLPGPSFLKHREYLEGSRVPFEAFYVHAGQMQPTGESLRWRLFQFRRAAHPVFHAQVASMCALRATGG